MRLVLRDWDLCGQLDSLLSAKPVFRVFRPITECSALSLDRA